MIQLSEAVGRFAEVLLWGILRTAGVIGAWVAIGGFAAVLAFVAARRLVRRRRG